MSANAELTIEQLSDHATDPVVCAAIEVAQNRKAAQRAKNLQGRTYSLGGKVSTANLVTDIVDDPTDVLQEIIDEFIANPEKIGSFVRAKLHNMLDEVEGCSL